MPPHHSAEFFPAGAVFTTNLIVWVGLVRLRNGPNVRAEHVQDGNGIADQPFETSPDKAELWQALDHQLGQFQFAYCSATVPTQSLRQSSNGLLGVLTHGAMVYD